MASPTCIKCGNNQFEINRILVAGRMDNYDFVNCTKCGAVVHVIDLSLTDTINHIANKLNV